VQLFTGGLLPPLSLHVQNQNPQSLARKPPARGMLPTPAPRPAPQPRA
jgi:hypothetical protein